MEKFKKYLIKKEYIVFGISLIIILLSSFSYAFFYSIDNIDEQIATTECFKLTLNDNNDINLDKTYPLSEEEGSLLNPYEFTIKNVCKKAGDYQINLETINDSTLSTNYLRYKLDDKESEILGNQIEVQEYINENISESRNIEVGIILPNEEKTYNLRLWIDEASTVEQSANKIYKSKVVIKTIDNKDPYKRITLNTDGGEISNSEIIRVKTRKIGELEEPIKEDYHFLGWYLDSSYTYLVDSDTVVTNEMSNLYAKWYKYVYRFNYTGSEQTFTVPCEGEYKLETWGAQGGNKQNTPVNNYGGYSVGNINFKIKDSLYINVGGQGTYTAPSSSSCSTTLSTTGGYNGGGDSRTGAQGGAGGGGATHIALKTGLLKNLSSSVSSILIVAGGGGGSASPTNSSGGGYVGSNGFDTWLSSSVQQYAPGFIGTGGSQTAGGVAYNYGTAHDKGNGSFGLGGTNTMTDVCGSNGGGGGFYGGGATGREHGGAGGGSGYIGNSLLNNKTMYCHNCSTSSATSTKTISTTCTNSSPTENCAKEGNGFVKITYLGE